MSICKDIDRCQSIAQNTIKFLIKVNHRKNINLNLAILENNYTFVLSKRLSDIYLRF